MKNIEVRQAARGAYIPMWKVANKLGVAEVTISRWMRVELPEEKRQRIMAAIEELKQEGA